MGSSPILGGRWNLMSLCSTLHSPRGTLSSHNKCEFWSKWRTAEGTPPSASSPRAAYYFPGCAHRTGPRKLTLLRNNPLPGSSVTGGVYPGLPTPTEMNQTEEQAPTRWWDPKQAKMSPRTLRAPRWHSYWGLYQRCSALLKCSPKYPVCWIRWSHKGAKGVLRSSSAHLKATLVGNGSLSATTKMPDSTYLV